jgi:glucan phosphorylase
MVQTIVDGFQHEQPDYWLNFGNPWEIERLNVGYPIHFYGHVSVHEEEGRQIFRWNPGESVGRARGPTNTSKSSAKQETCCLQLRSQLSGSCFGGSGYSLIQLL